ncbi:MAG: RnfH family protein [gamma proteobacterium symbiont of Bathyaustriella thionipta]|nr:RnfH family protein [gamma proteobacterium symbiont of Bathyaustriella thionipta]MCU7948972.1 RnfH family protein [gamma proteobacterium symbiont of Bathyaustriella thionipta]MCU7953974.1 RnfH family protein [gamma proteobacterium symbiont of Bathyaustriella thionipta]MCU7955517.1 RnfH family protein [gamma proteobacterium symbiont of Bathyaustriella thionipta]MCU7965698.1 RnfH family protein [gamma proteobacterium symbiont of Bathyaustriella thionipta]
MVTDVNPRQIIVEVAYATPASQLIYTVEVDESATVEDAIVASGILKEFPEIDLKANKVGVFSKLTKLDKPLVHKDRIEIYRKLIADPKAVRKQRAAEGKKMKKGT